MHTITAIGQLPGAPAIYAMYGGDARPYVAYVGIGDNLRRRVTQHLVLRNSSVTAGTGAVGLHADHVRAVEWWEHPTFGDRVGLEAAELVAFDVLEPALRSRGGITDAAKERAGEPAFRDAMTALFAGTAVGRLQIPTLPALADQVADFRPATRTARSADSRPLIALARSQDFHRLRLLVPSLLAAAVLAAGCGDEVGELNDRVDEAQERVREAERDVERAREALEDPAGAAREEAQRRLEQAERDLREAQQDN